MLEKPWEGLRWLSLEFQNDDAGMGEQGNKLFSMPSKEKLEMVRDDATGQTALHNVSPRSCSKALPIAGQSGTKPLRGAAKLRKLAEIPAVCPDYSQGHTWTAFASTFTALKY